MTAIADFFRFHIVSGYLKISGEYPAYIAILRTKSSYLCTAYDDDRDVLISEQITGGVSRRKSISLIKALVERVERTVIDEAGIKHSSGCAAYPIYVRKSSAIQKATKIALREAVERYVWHRWFTDADLGHDEVVAKGKVLALFDDVQDILSSHGLIKIHLVQPRIDHSRFKVTGAVAELKGGTLVGYGSDADGAKSVEHALGELLVRACAYRKYRLTSAVPELPAEKRFISKALKDPSLKNRLGQREGSRVLVVPEFVVNEVKNHKFSRSFVFVRAFLPQTTCICELGYA